MRKNPDSNTFITVVEELFS